MDKVLAEFAANELYSAPFSERIESSIKLLQDNPAESTLDTDHGVCVIVWSIDAMVGSISIPSIPPAATLNNSRENLINDILHQFPSMRKKRAHEEEVVTEKQISPSVSNDTLSISMPNKSPTQSHPTVLSSVSEPQTSQTSPSQSNVTGGV